VNVAFIFDNIIVIQGEFSISVATYFFHYTREKQNLSYYELLIYHVSLTNYFSRYEGFKLLHLIIRCWVINT